MSEGVRHLTAAEVGERLGVPTWSIYELAKTGELPAMKIGRRVRFRLEDIEQWEDEKVERTRTAAERRAGSAGS